MSKQPKLSKSNIVILCNSVKEIILAQQIDNDYETKSSIYNFQINSKKKSRIVEINLNKFIL